MRGQNAVTTGGNVVIDGGTGGSVAGSLYLGTLSESVFVSHQRGHNHTGPQHLIQDVTLGQSGASTLTVFRAPTAGGTGAAWVMRGQNAVTTGGDVYINGGTGGSSAGNVYVGSASQSVQLGQAGKTVNVVDYLTAGRISSSGSLTAASMSTAGVVTAQKYIGFGVVPIGTVLSHYVDMTNADNVAAVRARGFAICDGTTPAAQVRCFNAKCPMCMCAHVYGL